MKKTPRADLENERTTFFLLGFVVVLATLFVLLEWSSEEDYSADWAGFSTLYLEEDLVNEISPVLSQDNADAGVEKETSPDFQEPENVVYEDFKVSEKVRDMEDILSKMFEERAKIQERDFSHEELVKELTEKVVYTDAEIMPQFAGGYTGLVRFLFKNIQYPPDALQKRIQGRVWCSFIINKDGSVSDIRLEQSAYDSLDKEALRVLRLMPAWAPGSSQGKPVRVKYYLPVVFYI